MKTVTITVEGGVIQNVDLPDGVRAVVRDYDYDNEYDTNIHEDIAGDKYVESVWE